MLTNFLKDKCTIQVNTITHSALGDTNSWSDEGEYYCRRVPVDVQTKAAYMQNNTVVTDKFIFSGELDLFIGKHRIVYHGKTYELAESALHLENSTSVLTKEGIDG
jgi:hypothetical protein